MPAKFDASEPAALQQLLEQRDQQLAALHASSSWRLTAPLRQVGRLLQKLRRMRTKAGVCLDVLPEEVPDYTRWITQFDSSSPEVSANLRTQIDGFAELPLFSILMPCQAPTLAALEACLTSVQQQIYPNWELCIAAPAEADVALRAQLARWAAAEPRIKVSFATPDATAATAGKLAALTNHALGMVSTAVSNPSQWVLRLNATDLIASKAIYSTARAVNEHQNCRIVYADEDVLDATGQRSEPYFKCDWNPDLHESHNLIGRFGMYATALVKEMEGYWAEGDEVMDFDLSLRCVERVKAKQIHHVPQVLFHARLDDTTAQSNITLSAADRGTDAGKLALDAHFRRQGILARSENLGYGYRTRYALPMAQPLTVPKVFPMLPLVSLIIPTRNGLALLRQCIDSIVQKTTYRHYEIVVVDNGSNDLATQAYFKSLSLSPNIQVLRIDAPFNYSALNNAAVKVAKGELIGLVNNDIEVISPGWLGELVSHALRPGVGAVGARLWFPDETLQHGGVILGIHGWAAHAHNHFPRGSLGYKARMGLTQNFSAVTGACLLVRKSSYEAVGGLNEEALKISCNDVDFCLKLQKIGLRNVWTPFADLYHHESATRGFEDTPAKKARFAGELAYMQQHWAQELQADPAYSPNLTLSAQNFSLAWPPRVPSLVKQLDLQPGQAPLYERLATLRQGQVRVAYLAENVHSSTFRYRAANMVAVLNVAVAANDVQTSAACFFSGDLSHASDIVASADILVISRVRHDFATAALVQQFKAQGKKVWFDIDDWVFDPQAIGLIIHTAGQTASDEVLNYWHAVVSRMGQMLLLCDGVITTNHYLAQKLAKFANVPVKVIPNFANEQQLVASQPLYEKKTGQPSSSSDSIRLGYFSGSASHNRDIALLLPALEIVMAGEPRVQLVLVGPVELGEYGARFEQNYNHRIERHAFTDYVNLQQLIAGVDFNLVPLQANEFTHCKSELKYVDAANVGTLTIASPTHTYAAAIRHGGNGYLAADDQWLEVLLLAIATKNADLQAHQRMVTTAYQDVQNRFTYKTQRKAVLLALEVSHDVG
jgi:GT2 family glycosyltransferase